jgi:hypothetical protein
MVTKYYLAGPMSGIPQYNFPLFHEVARLLRGQGFTIVSPAEQDSPAVQKAAMASKDGKLVGKDNRVEGTKETWGDILSKDVKLVADGVDGIILLPGWQSSRGACLEVTVGLLVDKRPFRFFRWDTDDSEAVPMSKLTITLQVHDALVNRL